MTAWVRRWIFCCVLSWCQTCLFGASPWAALPKYGPNATPLSARSNLAYFQKNPAPDFWALIPYYLPQTNAQQCSAANFAMVLNAARSSRKQTADEKLVTIDTLLDQFTDAAYSEAMKTGSAKLALLDRSQVVIRRLTEVLATAVERAGLKTEKTRVELNPVEPGKKKDEARALFRERLMENEKSADDFMILNLVQGRMTGDPEGGAHVVTVGAYDAARKLLLILDPDRQWYEPYWSPEDVVFEAIADPKADGEKPGWIYFKVR